MRRVQALRKAGQERIAGKSDDSAPHKDFYDESNLQSLCNQCNMLKGQSDKKIIAEWRRQHPGGGSNLSSDR